jgi:carbon-monoxide dehydrogenase large subunit
VPELVDGQQQGGAAQGIAAALLEGVVYDYDGTPRTANLGDYLVPSAADLPTIETRRTETPSPLNPIGAKGIGQSGAIGAPGAVINAVLDALAPFGVRDLNPPFTPERVWHALRDARSSL